MTKSKLHFYLLYFFFFFTISRLYCMEKNEKFFRLNLGAGISNIDLSGGMALYFQNGKMLYSLRYIKNIEFVMDGPIPSEHIDDFGFLLGKVYRAPGILCSASTGIGMVNGLKRGRLVESGYEYYLYESIKFIKFGMPIEAQVFIGGNSLALGLYFFANLNSERSFSGFLLSLQIGKRANF